jgi:hypothetical protein
MELQEAHGARNGSPEENFQETGERVPCQQIRHAVRD